MKTDIIDVSIIVPVYNHEEYIEKALRSILSQKVNFNYEVFIGEDFSTDNSREILKRLEKEFPDNFHFIYREKNMGAYANIDDLRSRMNGRYFATLEGDDYWCYENKLQEQFDILEKNPNYLAVAHNTIVINKEGNTLHWKYPECKNNIFTIKDFENDLLPGQTATLLIRNYVKYNLFSTDIEPSKIQGDRKRNFFLFCNGDIYCIQKNWSCYRLVINSGTSYSATAKKMSAEDELQIYLAMYNYAKKNNIAEKKFKIIEKKYIYFILKKVLNKEFGFDKLKSSVKNSRYKTGVIFYLFRKVLERPIEVIKMKSNRKKYYNS